MESETIWKKMRVGLWRKSVQPGETKAPSTRTTSKNLKARMAPFRYDIVSLSRHLESGVDPGNEVA